MKRLVDRWGPARTSAAALAVMILLGGATFKVLKDEPGREMMDCARFSRVVLMGFAVANPDYSMRFNLVPDDECRPHPDHDDKIPPFDGSLEVFLGPRMSGMWTGEVPALSAEFRQHPSGEIRFPRPRPWRLTETITSPGSQDPKAENRLTLNTLKEMDWRRHRVHAVVTLKHPLDEAEVDDMHIIGLGETLLLSPGLDDKSFGWPYVYPGTIGGFNAFAGPKSTSRVEEFRRWVSLLKSEDEPALEQLGLDLSELRDRAEEGLIYGFTVINTPERVKRMVGNPKVRSVSVIDIAPEIP
ncbi:hypothetical protein AB0F88_39620 [Streptosporangium sp. NPDC023963]|uniref:hypothetical protein n=1 Tax=Streptosporangium sp. NPDC023963 TaxID=3155608 RepID=UPI003436966B